MSISMCDGTPAVSLSWTVVRKSSGAVAAVMVLRSSVRANASYRAVGNAGHRLFFYPPVRIRLTGEGDDPDMLLGVTVVWKRLGF